MKLTENQKIDLLNVIEHLEVESEHAEDSGNNEYSEELKGQIKTLEDILNSNKD